MLNKPRNISPTTVTIIVIAFISIALSSSIYFSSNQKGSPPRMIDGDGPGYFAYLDQIFLKHNFGHDTSGSEHIKTVNKHSLIKYSCGTAILNLPGFLVAKLFVTQHSSQPRLAANPFQMATSITALICLLAGLLFVSKLFRAMNISPGTGAAILFLTFAGTNLAIYTITMPSVSHVYSFFAISGFLFFFREYTVKQKTLPLITAALFLGLVYLIRPVNMIVILACPLFFASAGSFIRFIKSHPLAVLTFIVIFAGTALIQNLLWWMQSGKFIVWSYQNEGFYFKHPEILNVLFSFRKGFFLYTPLMLLFIVSIVVMLFRKDKYRLVVFLVFFAAITYLISSWWCWSYSDGFGMRPFIDFYPVIALFAALTVNGMNKILKRIFMLLALPAVLLNIVQSYQYQRGIIHPEYMNRQNYSYVFLRTSPAYINSIGGSNDLVPYDKFKKELLIDYSFPGMKSIGSNTAFALETNFCNYEELLKAKNLYAEISLEKLDPYPKAGARAYFGTALFYPIHPAFDHSQAFKIETLPQTSVNEWQTFSYRLILPQIRYNRFILRFFIWNPEHGNFAIRNLKIRISKTA